ncbi:MAG: hypothetical protein CVU39_09590 [Chloroflexi bacterium HGW-Chloroflexi-10]|nr:MAG: hypothetical protein CVU39_09590 [Chloroflexi bacterium HGW-Chloroflexi-10]
MPTKKYQADTMMEALEQVQKDLGPEAIVLSSREVLLGPPWQVWRKPGIEVVAMTPEKKQPTPMGQKPSAVIKPGQNNAVDWVEDRSQIEWVQEEVKTQRQPLNRPVVSNPNGFNSTVKPMREEPQKTAAGFPTEYLSREQATVKTPSFPKTQNEVIPTDKSAVNTLPSKRLVVPEANTVNRDDFGANLPEVMAQIRMRLVAQGVDSGLVDRLIRNQMGAFSPSMLADEARCQMLLKRQLEAGLKVETNFLMTSPSKVICLVGASGSGKTTTVSKLAVHFTKVLNKRVVWICADTVRAGAIAETRAYADAIGVALRLVYTPQDLKEAMMIDQNADILLVDTPGYNPCDEQQMVELGAMLTQVPERSTYLVAPATTKEPDLLQAVASLGLFKIRGLIITKLDETYSFGSVYNFVYQSQLPLALFSTGKQVLGDLRQAEASKLVAALFGKGWE